MRIALVVYEGVLDDECVAFGSVLGLLPGAELFVVGAERITYPGVGGSQVADLAFADVAAAEIVVVPGGLGCERAADDRTLREFLIRMERSARLVAASSTGSVVLAAAGLLHGAPAATHWLAGSLLARYGSEADQRRLVVQGNVITCEGRLSAVDAAFAIVERIAGSSEVERIRATLLERGEALLRGPGPWERLIDKLPIARRRRTPRDRSRPPLDTPRDRAASTSGDPARPRRDGATTTPLSVMVELVDDEDLVRTMKRRSDRVRRR